MVIWRLAIIINNILRKLSLTKKDLVFQNISENMIMPIKDLHSLCITYVSDLDVGEIQTFRSRQMQHEEAIFTIEANLKDLQTAIREKEDEAAGFQRERVSQNCDI